MASQVLSGSSNPSYTNNTGQNVRVVINFMSNTTSISWAGVSVSSSVSTIGRNIAFRELVDRTGENVNSTISIPQTLTPGVGGYAPPLNNTLSIPRGGSLSLSSNNCASSSGTALPTELMLAPSQTFSATCGAYNIVVIPEAG